jgi:hypothetical protein
MDSVKTLTILENASIITQPVSQHICDDGLNSLNVSLEVLAAGANLSYQWYKNGLSLLGETNPTLDVVASGSDEYYVEVSNACKVVSSDKVTVSTQLNIIEQKRNHTLWVNNVSASNGGYSFAYYVWTQDGSPLQQGSHNDNFGVYYTGGGDLSLNSLYQVHLTTTDGRQFLSCPYYYLPQSFGASVRAYPNPVVKNAVKQVFVDVEIDDASVLSDATISIYSSEGKFLGTVRCDGRRITPIDMPSVTGVYVLKFVSSSIEKEIKIIVE